MSIETRLVYGFPKAGKTYYISDCIKNDYFYKYGSTLILCFEDGELSYDEEALKNRRTSVVYYGGNSDIEQFCQNAIELYKPERIYVEMNSLIKNLVDCFPPSMKISYACSFLNWENLKSELSGRRQEIGQMVSSSQQITFRGCPSKALLAPYSQIFRLMNAKASYLRQDPMGYHEKAFDLFLPFSYESSDIFISRNDYLPLWLDSLDHPEHYEGKTLHFTDALEIRKNTDGIRAGLVVMTCCMADLQFLSFRLKETENIHMGWATFDARVNSNLELEIINLSPAKPPKDLIFNPSATKTPSVLSNSFRGLPRFN